MFNPPLRSPFFAMPSVQPVQSLLFYTNEIFLTLSMAFFSSKFPLGRDDRTASPASPSGPNEG
jgi:hypothetical protein